MEEDVDVYNYDGRDDDDNDNDDDDDDDDVRIELLKKSGLKLAETEDIVDEEEFKLMKELREVKRSYKNAFEQMQRHKAS